MNKRWHIAHFSNAYYPVISGVVRSVSAFRQALTEQGHNVFIFAQHAHDYEDEEPFIFRYPAIELPMANQFPVAIPISRFIDRLLPILKLAVIHSHHPFLLGQTAARKAAELDVPLVFTFHTRYREYSHYVSLNQKFVKEAIERWLGDYMEQCHHVIVPSDSIRRLLAETYGVEKQVTALPTGIDLAPYQAADGKALRREKGWRDEIVLVSVGRLAKEKNWRTLIAATAEAGQSFPAIHLVIIGDGDERESLEKYCRELGIAERVTFTGLIPFEQVPAYLKAADLFVFASVTETQGLVTMEALAAGLPVVAVDATGTSDVVDHEQEALLTSNDSQALAEAIRRILQDDDLRRRLQAAGQERIKSFDIQNQAQRLVEVYRQAEEDRQAGRHIKVDRHKPIFKMEWYELLGLDHNPFTRHE